MKTLTLSLSNTINLESHGFLAQGDLFRFMWETNAIFNLFITFTQYKLTLIPVFPVNDIIHCNVK